MAEAASDRNDLKDAILRVWTPTLGVVSIQELWFENLCEILGVGNEDDSSLSYQLVSALISLTLFEFVLKGYKLAFQTDLSKYFDNQEPFQLDETLVSGSWSEGLFVNFDSSTEIPPPDVDFMCILKNIKFTTRDQLFGNLRIREDTPFVHAYISDEECAKLWKDFLHDFSGNLSKKHRLSSIKLKEKFFENYSSVGNLFRLFSNDLECHVQSKPESSALSVEKPAVCMRSLFDRLDKEKIADIDIVDDKISTLFEAIFYKLLPASDIVLALSCDGWPSCAKEWITRERIWPREDLVKKIAQQGFHIVPKISQEGDFRLSFSFAETTLIKQLSLLQHKTLKSFKAIVKYHQISWGPKLKEVIKTYYLKTIAFWYFEKTAPDSFSDDTVVTHLILLLQELAEAMLKQELPMYFMPKVNLLEGVTNSEEAINLFEKVMQLSTNCAAMTKTVQKLSRDNLSTSVENVFRNSVFEIVLESAKQTKNSDLIQLVENYFIKGSPRMHSMEILTTLLHIVSINESKSKL